MTNPPHMELLEDYMTISSNRFTYLPDTIEKLTSLRELKMDKNIFDCLLFLPVAEYLEELNINNNKFYGALPANLYELRNLKYLGASNNKFDGSISTNIGNLRELIQLNLRDNDLSGAIPEELGNAKNLEILRLHYNKFNGTVPNTLCMESLTKFYADCKNDLVNGDQYYGSGTPELNCSCCTDCCNPGKGSKCERRDVG